MLLAFAALAATSFSSDTSTVPSSLRSTRAAAPPLRAPRSAGQRSSQKHHAATTEKPASNKSDVRHALYVTPETGLREAFFKRCGVRCEGFDNTDCKWECLWNFYSFN
jgi:hypothetical protein